MIRFSLEDKTPREADIYTINWSRHLPENDTLTGGPPELETLEGSIIMSDGANDVLAGQSSFRIAGGQHGEVCRGRVSGDTNGGSKLDAIVTIGIRKGTA